MTTNTKNHTTPVVLYTWPTCPYCIAAKRLLEQKGIAYSDTDITSNQTLRNELIAKTGHKTVPMIFVKDTFIGGFDNLQALNHSGELDTLLNS